MEEKKRDTNIIPILVAIVALIGLALWYNYLGDYTIKKVDTALGIDTSLKINDLVIEKGYNENGGIRSPEIKISYTTSSPSESYIKVNDVMSNKTVSDTFSKTIILNRDYFGKSVMLTIYAKDAKGKEATVKRNISIQTSTEPIIAIINT